MVSTGTANNKKQIIYKEINTSPKPVLDWQKFA